MKKLFGLIGYPLSHSLSSQLFSDFFREMQIDAEYINFEIDDIGQLTEIISQYPDLIGLNVTSPYKEQIIPWLNSLSPTAQTIQAVNCISINHSADLDDFSTVGYNTDAEGFSLDLKTIEIPDGDAIILGSGGAARAVAFALKNLGRPYRFVSRKPLVGQLSYDDISKDILADTALIVNATPLGKHPDDNLAPEIPYQFIKPATVCYDLNYNPDPTRFMTLAADSGAVTKSGIGMLKYQALLSWLLWQNNGKQFKV